MAGECTPFAHVVFPQMSTRELLAYVANELGAPLIEQPSFSIEESLRRLQCLLGSTVEQGSMRCSPSTKPHLLADSHALETIRLLLNLNTDGPPALTVLLVGQTSLLTAIDRQQGLEERLSVKCLLRPFTIEETASYVTHRLSAAGAQQEIFTPDALSRLFQLTAGNPRRINRLCDLVLLIGYAEERTIIGADQVEAVSG